MKPRRLLAALVAACAWLAPAAPASAGGPGGPKRPVCAVVTAVEGEPRLLPMGRVPERLRVGQFLYKKDAIQTGKNEMASLALLCGVELRLNANTRFEAGDGGGPHAPGVVALKVGQIWSRALNKKSAVDVQTWMGLAAVRGTEAEVALAERMTVKVYAGRVDVSNEAGSQPLAAGMMTEVLGLDSPPEPPRMLRPSDRGSWQDDLSPGGAEEQLERLRAEAEAADEETIEIETMKDGKRTKVRLKLRRR